MQIMSCKYPPPDFSVLYKINWDRESHTSCDSATGLAAHQPATLTFAPLNLKQPSQLVEGADLVGVQVAKPCWEWQKHLGEPSEVSSPHHSYGAPSMSYLAKPSHFPSSPLPTPYKGERKDLASLSWTLGLIQSAEVAANTMFWSQDLLGEVILRTLHVIVQKRCWEV